jgi:predicted lipoprotein with Yx(FWY)xxD motif
MNRFVAVSVGAVAVAALAAGCGSSGSSSGSSPSSPTAGERVPGPSGSSTGLHTENSPYGQILVNGSGRTLYLLTADNGSQSSCYAECASIWPPDTQAGAATGGKADSAKVGTTTRTDNSQQVTYNGHPLYTYAQDSKSGDVNGQGLNTFGGTWYVVGPDGNPVTGTPSPSTGSGGGGGGY